MRGELWIYAGVCAAFGALVVLGMAWARPPSSCWPVFETRPQHATWPHNG